MHLHAPCLQVKFLGDEIILEKKERQVLRLEANQAGPQGGRLTSSDCMYSCHIIQLIFALDL